jgi:N-acetylglucosamine kinase-like BadF-type ATPase
MERDVSVGGVDAGGSHTVAVIVDARGQERARAKGPGAAVHAGSEAASADVITRLIADAARRADGHGIEALVVGAAGAGHPPVRVALTQELLARGAPRRTQVVTDAEAAFASAFEEGPGVLLLSGTGSIAVARDPAGEWHRAGGWGWRVGDEGSGFAIGRAGVAAVGRALDGRGPTTTLREVLPDAAGVVDAGALMAWAREAAPAELAALAGPVQGEARGGDPVADGIVRAAAGDLVAHVVALQSRFPASTVIPVVLAGGALRSGGPLRAAVNHLAAGMPRVAIHDRPIDAAHGAAWLAQRLLTGRS